MDMKNTRKEGQPVIGKLNDIGDKDLQQIKGKREVERQSVPLKTNMDPEEQSFPLTDESTSVRE
jgi:hypothetical protein